MNFKTFSTSVRGKIHDPDEEIDDEYLNELYQAFKEQQYFKINELNEWIEFWFEDNEVKTHKFYLKTKIV